MLSVVEENGLVVISVNPSEIHRAESKARAGQGGTYP